MEELIRESDGLMVSLFRRPVVSEIEDWDNVLWSGFEVVEIVRVLCVPFDPVLTFGVGRRVALKAVCRTSSRYVIVASRKAVLCDVLAHGYIGNI